MGTGSHYHNVAAQMHDYVNNPYPQRQGYASQPYYSPAGGAMPMIASQVIQYGAQRLGVDPVVINQVGGFARTFMRNVLS